MHCLVYQLRERGERLPREIAIERGTPGYLKVWGNVFDKGSSRELLAHLEDKPSTFAIDVIPPLSRVRLLAVKGNGFCLRGDERVLVGDGRKATHQIYDQSWWCVPI